MSAVTLSSQPAGVALAVGAMSSIQLGIALSEPLLHEVGAAGIVSLRLLMAAALLWVLTRPVVRGRSGADVRVAIALGVCCGAQTFAFFAALDRIPLGVAVTIEFLGPLGVALAGSRRGRDAAWVALAGAGVALLTLGPGSGGLDPLGVALAAVAACCWAGYITLTKRVGARWSGLDGLAVSLAVAAALTIAPGVATAGTALVDPEVLLAGAGLALLLPLAPYSLEMLALRQLPTAVFGLLMSLEPAIGAALGFVLLGQDLGVAAILAVGLVVAASAGATLSALPPGTSAGPASRRPLARRARWAAAARARA
jgi:inner membrane transporter RhtA